MSENNSPAWFLRRSSKAAKLQPETRLYYDRPTPQKHEHEWAYTSETSVRVHWDGRKWCARYEPHNYVMVHRDLLVAEIARLAGLTEPESQEEAKPANPLFDHVWRCECCGEMADVIDGSFRMAGDRWQHSHPEAQTSFNCRDFGPKPEGEG